MSQLKGASRWKSYYEEKSKQRVSEEEKNSHRNLPIGVWYRTKRKVSHVRHMKKTFFKKKKKKFHLDVNLLRASV